MGKKGRHNVRKPKKVEKLETIKNGGDKR